MLNIAYYSQLFNNLDCPAYKVFDELNNKYEIDNSVIFTDKLLINLNTSLPIFSSFYLRHTFIDYTVIINDDNINYIDIYKLKNVLIVSDTIIKHPVYKCVKATPIDINKIFKELFYEKL